MRIASLLLAFTFTAGTVSLAQHAPAASPTVLSIPAPVSGCPVDFGASVSSRAVLNAAHSAPGQSTSDKAGNLTLSLTFAKPGSDTPAGASGRAIAGAGVLVHGISGKPRVISAGAPSNDDRAQSFQLNPPKGAPTLLQSSVQVDQMMFVNWAEITELHFTDGSVWHPSGNSQCHATPSGFRLIGATAR